MGKTGALREGLGQGGEALIYQQVRKCVSVSETSRISVLATLLAALANHWLSSSIKSLLPRTQRSDVLT